MVELAIAPLKTNITNQTKYGMKKRSMFLLDRMTRSRQVMSHPQNRPSKHPKEPKDTKESEYQSDG